MSKRNYVMRKQVYNPFLTFHEYIPDGTLMMKYICFNPAVLNDNGIIRVYYGTQYSFEEEPDFFENEYYIQEEMKMFG